MEEKTCKNCAFFRLHYIRYGRGRYSPLHYGHCVKNEKACAYWTERKM